MVGVSRISAMRGRIFIVVLMLGAISPYDGAYAQLSPQGVLGGITRPFRQMFGHFGHFPRYYRHRAEARGAAASPTDPSAITGSRLGSAGAPAWPTAYEDVLGFTFWPDDYAFRLRGRGFDVIADTITGRFDMPRVSARTATTGTTATDAPSANGCGSEPLSSSQDPWPAGRIQQMLQLSNAQPDALEKLQANVTQSVNSLRADCQTEAATPSDRMRNLVQRLWAVRDAGISTRSPVKNFYDTLTDAQKNSFISRQPVSNPPSDQKTADNGMNRQYQACAAQNVERAERLIKEIEMRIRPNKDQAASLENLHKTSSDMAKLLIASCAQPIPADPLARLDAAADRLTALNYAATTVQIAFDDFYSKLSNDQKARFGAR
jgi:LTXXQ motif family protein